MTSWHLVVKQLTVGQVNALDITLNEGEVLNQKNRLLDTLLEMTAEHYSIASVSASRKSVRHIQQNQTNDLKLSTMGGMSKASKPLMHFRFSQEMEWRRPRCSSSKTKQTSIGWKTSTYSSSPSALSRPSFPQGGARLGIINISQPQGRTSSELPIRRKICPVQTTGCEQNDSILFYNLRVEFKLFYLETMFNQIDYPVQYYSTNRKYGICTITLSILCLRSSGAWCTTCHLVRSLMKDER